MANQPPSNYTRAPAQRPVPQQRPDPLAGIMGNFSDPARIGAALREAAANFHLIGAGSVGALPMGCEVAISPVWLSPNKDDGDIYDVGFGKWGLSRPAVDKLAAAARLTTVASQCLRFETRYAEWRVVRAMRDLNGGVRSEAATRIIDLREGSQYLANLRAKARDRANVDKQVNEILGMLGAHAETKARLRADRALLGIRTYTQEELRKPFVVPALVFTGHSPDPEIRRMFAMATAQAFLNGQAALYGGGVGQSLPMMGSGMGGGMGAPMMMGGGQPAPMLGMGAPMMPQGDGGFAPGVGEDDYDATTGEVGPPAAPQQPAQPPTAARKVDPGRVYMPGKKGEAGLVKDAADKDLAYWGDRLEKNLPDSRYPDSDREKLQAIRMEQARRRGEVAPDQEPPRGGEPVAAPGPSGLDDPEDFDRNLWREWCRRPAWVAGAWRGGAMLTTYAVLVTVALVLAVSRWRRAESRLQSVVNAAVVVCAASGTTLAQRLPMLRQLLLGHAHRAGWRETVRRLETTEANHENAVRSVNATHSARCSRCGEAITSTHGVKWSGDGPVHLACDGVEVCGGS